MAGIRIDDLPLVTGIQNSDNFVVTRSNTTNRTTGENLLQALSGVRSVENATGSGVPVFKGNINAAYGTTAQFNSLSAGKGLNLTTSSSVIGFSIENQKIVTDMIKDENVTTEKLAQNSVTASKMNYPGSVLQIQHFASNVRMGTNSNTPVAAGAEVTINPIRSNSKFMVMVNTMLGTYANWPYITVYRYVGGVPYNIQVNVNNWPTRTNAAMGTYEADYSWQYTAQQTNFHIFDQPNTTSPVTYRLMVWGQPGGGSWTYIGAAWYWYAYVSPTDPGPVMTPTTMTVFEIQS